MNVKPLLFTTLFAAALPASATSLFQPIELRDAELASLRGRYVLPDRIINFGVTMTTLWQNSSGASIGAQVVLQVNNQAQANLTVTPLYEAGNGSTVSTGSGQVLGGAGLSNVQGIVQSVRTAGDFNKGLNDLSVEISHNSGDAMPNSGQSWTGDQQFNNSAGSINISSAKGGLQLALQANNNQGFAQQQIGLGGVRQQSNITGALNNVQNLAALNVALRDNPRGLDGLQCAWDQIRTMRPAGY
ncbi:MAG: hypothetical protein Q7U01_05325 [Pseudomonas sp.]|nr:hypothetical protein [Pseudomonas sp.]